MTFKEDAIEWLLPFGYEISSEGASGKWLCFSNYRDMGENYPTIECFINEIGERQCKLSYSGLKMLVSLQTVSLSFKHREIEKFISVMKHYADICEDFQPRFLHKL